MPPLREWFIANGYAWAASSYSKNDYDVAQGAKDTHALTKFFNGLVGKPKHTYIAGVSMGGHVTAVSIEQWPNTYDGALPACGVLGDYELFDYLLDFNLVAQAQAGITAQFPPASNYLTTTVPTIKASLELYPGYFPFALNQAGENYKAALKYLSGGQRPLYDEGFLFWTGFTNNALFGLGMSDGTLARSPGVAVDNSSTVYQFDADPTLSPAEQMLNNTILRISQDLQGRHRAGLANVPPISGKITVPVLTLHTLGDLFVPFSMEQIYAERVAVNGASDLLVQRAIRDVGHCSFTGYELVTAFEDLVNWVENDTKPLGDNVTDPIAVADPNFGCAFTQGTHPTIEAIRPYIPLPACP
jgi:pimeloyl-ACP methyl ester carboxylesterase